MSVDKIEINLDLNNRLKIYHYFTELLDPLRPILHYPDKLLDQIQINYWFEKLFQLRSIINDIIEPGDLIAIQVNKNILDILKSIITPVESFKDAFNNSLKSDPGGGL